MKAGPRGSAAARGRGRLAGPAVLRRTHASGLRDWLGRKADRLLERDRVRGLEFRGLGIKVWVVKDSNKNRIQI
jgi:hypothetical protein